jgi:hypothetical protein
MHVASALTLHDGDRARLEALTRMSTAPAGLVQRARIVLPAAEGGRTRSRSQSEYVGAPQTGDLPPTTEARPGYSPFPTFADLTRTSSLEMRS